MYCSSRKRGYLAIDIEKPGSSFHYPIIAFGTCFGDGTLSNLDCREWIPKFDPNKIQFEERCKREFWDKNQKVLDYFQMNGKGKPEDVFNNFNNYLTKLECENDITILSDNPSFDISNMDYYLDKYCKRLPLHYSHKGDYRPVVDWTERASALCCEDDIRAIASNKFNASATHLPLDDAKNIYVSSILTEECRLQHRKKYIGNIVYF